MERLIAYGNDPAISVKMGSDHLLRRFERKSKSAPGAESSIGAMALVGTGVDDETAAASVGTTAAGTESAVSAVAASSPTAGSAQQAGAGPTMDTAQADDGGQVGATPSSTATPPVAHAAGDDLPTPENAAPATGAPTVPLLEYISNTMRFVEVVLNNQSLTTSSAHAEQFAAEGGLDLLLKFYALPNLPLTFCHSSAASSLNTAFRALSAHMPAKALKGVAEAVTAVDVSGGSKQDAGTNQPFSEVLRLDNGPGNALLQRLCVVGRYSELLLSLMQHHAGAQRSPVTAYFSSAPGKALVDSSMSLNKLLILQMGLLTQEFHANRRALASEPVADSTVPSSSTVPSTQDAVQSPANAAVASAAEANDTASSDGAAPPAASTASVAAAGTLNGTSLLLQHLCQIHSSVVGVLSQLFRQNSSHRRRAGFFGGPAERGGSITDHVSRGFAALVQATTIDKDAMQEESAVQLLDLHHVSHIVGQLRLFIFDPLRQRSSGDRKVGKLNVSALASVFSEGVFTKFMDVVASMIEHLDPANQNGEHATNAAKPLSKHELFLKCGQTAESPCHKCSLTICDVDLVYAHGGGAWVCNSCDGQVQGRIAYHCGPCDYDTCPPCFARKEKKGNQRAYSKILQEALSLVAKVLELPQGRDGNPVPTPSSQDQKLMQNIRRLVAKTIGPLWSTEVLERCDAEIIKSALHVIGHCLVAERLCVTKAEPTTDTLATSDNGTARSFSTLSETFQRLLAPSGHPSDASSVRSPSTSNNAPVPAFVADATSVAMLTSMGFSVERATHALEMTTNDLAAATELILVGGDIDTAAPSASTSQASINTSQASINTSQASINTRPDDSASDPLSPIAAAANASNASNQAADEDEEDEEALLARAIAMSMAEVDDDVPNAQGEPAPDAASQVAATQNDSTDASQGAADTADPNASGGAAQTSMDASVAASADSSAQGPSAPGSAQNSTMMSNSSPDAESSRIRPADVSGGSAAEASSASRPTGRLFGRAAPNLNSTSSGASPMNSTQFSMDLLSMFQSDPGMSGMQSDDSFAGARTTLNESRQNSDDAHAGANVKEMLMDGAISKCLQLSDRCDLEYAPLRMVILEVVRQSTDPQQALGLLTSTIAELCNELISSVEGLENLARSKSGFQLASRLNIFILVCADEADRCVEAASTAAVIGPLISLLKHVLAALTESGPDCVGTRTSKLGVPVFVTPLIILLDQYDKNAAVRCKLLEKRLATLKKGAGRWEYRSSDGFGWGARPKWDAYTAAQQLKIEQAYALSQPSVTISNRNAVYRIDLNRMEQTNTSTSGAPRPIRRSTSAKPAEQSSAMLEQLEKMLLATQPITEAQHTLLIDLCASYLKFRLDADLLEGTLRLTHQLTRDYNAATQFADQGGLLALLKTRQASMSKTTTMLISLVVRHIVENNETLECLFRAEICKGLAGFEDGKAFLSELLSTLSHLVSRNAPVFESAAKHTLQLVPDTELEEGESGTLVKCSAVAKDDDALADVKSEGLVRTIELCVSCIIDGVAEKRKTAAGKVAEQSAASEASGDATATGSMDSSADNGGAPVDSGAVMVGSATSKETRNPGGSASSLMDLKTHEWLIFQPCRLLGLVSELVKSYPASVPILLGSTTAPELSKKAPWGQYLMQNLAIRATANDGERESQNASRLFAVCAMSKCATTQGMLVKLLNNGIASILMQKRPVQSLNVVMIAELVHKIISQSLTQRKARAAANNVITRMMVSDKLQVGLMRLISLADIFDPDASKEVDAVLRPLEMLSRFARAPAEAAKQPPSKKPAAPSNTEAPPGASNAHAEFDRLAEQIRDEILGEDDGPTVEMDIPLDHIGENDDDEDDDDDDDEDADDADDVEGEWVDVEEGSGMQMHVGDPDDDEVDVDDDDESQEDEMDDSGDESGVDNDDGSQEDEMDDEDEDDDEDDDDDDDDDDVDTLDGAEEDDETNHDLVAGAMDEYDTDIVVDDGDGDEFMVQEDVELNHGGGEMMSQIFDDFSGDPGMVVEDDFMEEDEYAEGEGVDFADTHLEVTTRAPRHHIRERGRMMVAARPHDARAQPLTAQHPMVQGQSRERGDDASSRARRPSSLRHVFTLPPGQDARTMAALQNLVGSRGGLNALAEGGRLRVGGGSDGRQSAREFLERLLGGMTGSRQMNESGVMFDHFRNEARLDVSGGFDAESLAIIPSIEEQLNEDAKKIAAKDKAEKDKAEKDKAEKDQADKDKAEKDKADKGEAEKGEAGKGTAKQGSVATPQAEKEGVGEKQQAPVDGGAGETPKPSDTAAANAATAGPDVATPCSAPASAGASVTSPAAQIGAGEGESAGAVSSKAVSSPVPVAGSDVGSAGSGGAASASMDTEGAPSDPASETAAPSAQRSRLARGRPNISDPDNEELARAPDTEAARVVRPASQAVSTPRASSTDTSATAAAAATTDADGSYEEDFLAALPEDIRREVLASQQVTSSESSVDVPREFLEALPPDLQREVLEQERRQQQQARPPDSTASTSASASTSTPASAAAAASASASVSASASASSSAAVPAAGTGSDAASFIATLTPELRAEILLEHSHDEAFLAQLPADMRDEARAHRNRLEREHHREQLFQRAQRATPSYMRSPGRGGGHRYGPGHGRARGHAGNEPTTPSAVSTTTKSRDGRAVLEPEHVLQLVRVLFCQHAFDAKLLYRTMLNLCAHQKTQKLILSTSLALLVHACKLCARGV